MANIFVALSGGVDSAVSAALLVEQGHQVTSIFMKNWSGEDLGISDQCPWKRDQDDAQAVCTHLGIPFKTYNFEKEYRAEVIEYFFEEYQSGRTPNPDIICNQKIKFGRFLTRALSEGADMIATGHYARKRENSDGTCDLIRAEDQNKDQTYFLCRLKQDQLSKSVFPIGDLAKPQVRNLARKFTLPVAEKKDSQGVCFVGKIDFPEFLKTRIKPRKGDIFDIDTKAKVGEHNGSWFYTLGQRQGLRIGGAGEPYFVAGKDTENNILYVAKGRDNPRLYTSVVKISDIHWINMIPEDSATGSTGTPGDLLCMVRYRQKPVPCMLQGNTLTFESPVWTPAPGQEAVLIHDQEVLGSATIL